MEFVISSLLDIRVLVVYLIITIFIYLILRIMFKISIKIGQNYHKNYDIKYFSRDENLHQNLNENFAYDYASCFDIQSAEEKTVIEPGKSKTMKTGLYFCLPFNLELQVRPKSGISQKQVAVCLGTVDGDYRGEVGVTIYNLSDMPYTIEYGDKIAQCHIDEIKFNPSLGDKFTRVDSLLDFPPELSKTKRGDRGFGSSGI